jgi:hypothetical protein
MATLVCIFELHQGTGVNNYKLYDDIGSFRSVIKKAAQDAIPSGYAVLAPISAVSREARTTAVKAQATALLQDAEYLHGTPNEQVCDLRCVWYV